MVGFYSASPDAVFAIADTGEEAMGADDVLFHEYSHHFMLENFPAAYPGWFVEGWAEYYMTTKITPKDVTVGGYNPNRAYWLFDATWLPMGEVLSKNPLDFKGSKDALYYAQSWLLMHYMLDNRQRAAQLDKATVAIAAGENPVKAFTAATGMDMESLAHELKRYRKLSLLKIANPTKGDLHLTLTRMPRSSDDFLLDDLRLTQDDGRKPDPEFLARLRKRAAAYPGDRQAELTLARAEFTLGDVAAGEAIVKRRLEADPDDLDVLRVAATGQIRAGQRDPAQRRPRFQAARALLGRAYHLDKDDYRILFAYAYCRFIEPDYPSQNDLAVLLDARALAPAVEETSLLAGQALIRRGRRPEAIRVLTPVANNPHGGGLSAAAVALIAGGGIDAAGAIEKAAQAQN